MSIVFKSVSPRTPLDKEPPVCPDPVTDPVDFCRWVVAECSAKEAPDLEGEMCLVDMTSASIVVQVWDGINETNRAKYLAKTEGNVPMMVAFAWKVLTS